jgi:hypothetical protein
MEKIEVLKEILINVFKKLSIFNSDFIDVCGYKTTEIKISNFLNNIGIGINDDSSSLCVFMINKKLKVDDKQRFRLVFSISCDSESLKSSGQYLSIDFMNESLKFKELGDIQSISEVFQSASYIMQEVEKAEKKILNALV